MDTDTPYGFTLVESAPGCAWKLTLLNRGRDIGGGWYEAGDDGYQAAFERAQTWLAECLREPGQKRKPGRPRVHADAAARQAAYVARKGVSVTVILPPDVAEAFAEYMRRHSMDGAGGTRSEVLSKLIAAQLLRKR